MPGREGQARAGLRRECQGGGPWHGSSSVEVNTSRGGRGGDSWLPWGRVRLFMFSIVPGSRHMVTGSPSPGGPQPGLVSPARPCAPQPGLVSPAPGSPSQTFMSASNSNSLPGKASGRDSWAILVSLLQNDVYPVESVQIRWQN